jgi:hypothetical protein
MPDDTTKQEADIDADGTQLVASPAQLFAGMPVGLPSLVVVCAHCGRR